MNVKEYEKNSGLIFTAAKVGFITAKIASMFIS